MQIPGNILGSALPDQYFDLKGLNIYSSMGISTLRDYIRSGDLPHFKLKGKILIKRSEFDKWLENFRTAHAKQNLNELVDEILTDFKS